MKFTKIIFTLLIVFGITYYALDRQLFYYGKSDFTSYNLLPLNVIPDYPASWGWRFTLRDENGSDLTYSYPIKNRNIFINKVLKYTFSNNQVVAIVSDSSGVIYTLKLSPPLHIDYDISGTLYPGDKTNQYKYKWININGNNDYIYTRVLIRNWVTLTCIVLILILLYRSIQLIKKRKKSFN